MVGRAKTVLSVLCRPDRPIGGMPGPKAPAGTAELTVLEGMSSSAPASSSDRLNPDSVAGFQNSAPAGLSGAAVATPANERLTGPAPERIAPYCARASPRLRVASTPTLQAICIPRGQQRLICA